MASFEQVVRNTVADEATIATALNDKADDLEKAGNYKAASVYRNAATDSEYRARVWRQLLK